MILAITGGRSYADEAHVRRVLSSLDPRPELVIHGGATGADALADRVAREFGITVRVFPAEWTRYGRSAGPRRNSEILAFGPDLVIAFPGDRGTADMVRRARAAGIEVREESAPAPSTSRPGFWPAARLSASLEPAIGPQGRTLELRVEVEDPQGRRVQGSLLGPEEP